MPSLTHDSESVAKRKACLTASACTMARTANSHAALCRRTTSRGCARACPISQPPRKKAVMSGTCVTEPHVLCDTCGTTVITPLEETHTCSYCGETFHDDTPPTCLSCGTTCCQECEQNYLAFCNECGLNVCIDCMNTCGRCDEPVCDECKNVCDVCYCAYCKQCWEEHEESNCCDYCKPQYHYPDTIHPRYVGQSFLFGIEIEIDGTHDDTRMKQSPLIAGWCPDQSLKQTNSREYQTHPLRADSDTMRQLRELIAQIPDTEGNAGGHIHIQRTPRQTPSRWYWALDALDEYQAYELNMRHVDEDNNTWCQLIHGGYKGKNTAINAKHTNTIELRTFGAWHENTVDMLQPAIHWIHTMWRLFEKYPIGTLTINDIQATAHTAYCASFPTPPTRTQRYLAHKQSL